MQFGPWGLGGWGSIRGWVGLGSVGGWGACALGARVHRGRANWEMIAGVLLGARVRAGNNCEALELGEGDGSGWKQVEVSRAARVPCQEPLHPSFPW
jgi:hypothetical protein